MEIEIMMQSVVAPILAPDGLCICEPLATKLRELDKFARQNVVKVFIYDDKAKFVGRKCETRTIPQICRKDADWLFEWLRKKISKAW